MKLHPLEHKLKQLNENYTQVRRGQARQNVLNHKILLLELSVRRKKLNYHDILEKFWTKLPVKTHLNKK